MVISNLRGGSNHSLLKRTVSPVQSIKSSDNKGTTQISSLGRGRPVSALGRGGTASGLGRGGSASGLGRGGTDSGLGRGGTYSGLGRGESVPGLGRCGTAPGLGRGGSVPGLRRGGIAPGLGRGGSVPGPGRGGTTPGLGRGETISGLGQSRGPSLRGRDQGGMKPRACFNCSGTGHLSRDCPEPRTTRPVGGSCFNCGKEGHLSRDCTEPKKERHAGKCFNCNKENVNHIARDCPEPKKERLAEVDINGNPINRKYVPIVRSIEELYLEDKQNEELYRQVVDGDEDIRVTGSLSTIKLDTWHDAGFEEQVLVNVKEKSMYSRPRKIQAYTIPYIMEGHDVLGQAETGSGKTAAFMTPLICKIMNMKPDVFASHPCNEISPYAIVVAPTRELCLQICEQGQKFADKTVVKVGKTYGMYNIPENIRELRSGCDILCATPGRLKMLIKNGIVTFKNLKYFVLDEADRLLDGNFINDIREITAMPGFPEKEERQTLMFSATFMTFVQNLAKEMLRVNYVLVSNAKFVHASSRVKQAFLEVSAYQKNSKLLEMLKTEIEEAKEHYPDDPRIRRTLVFVSTREQSKVLALYLAEYGIPSMMINGDMCQDLRERALKEFREYRTPVLVSTDVCARGIDIKELDHVINYDLPHETTTYVHRIGRTGRIQQGYATSFFDPNGKNDLRLANDLVQFVRDTGETPPEFLVRSAENMLGSYGREGAQTSAAPGLESNSDETNGDV